LNFEQAHSIFIDEHLRKRSGERHGRLQRGHLHAEQLFLRNVWWPLQGHFRNLHPEYEVFDWRGRSYFSDFAWLPGHVKLLIEIKGFAAHVRDMDRQKYCNELNRETFLHAMGYHVISFAYDDVEHRPEVCITLLRMVLSRHQPSTSTIHRTTLADKEIVQLALQSGQHIRPKDVELHFNIDHKTSVKMLRNLCDKGWLTPVYRGNQVRIVQYKLVQEMLKYID